jgi:hypothetical protein
MTPQAESQYCHLWEAKASDWVLLKSPYLLGGYCVFNKASNALMHIEDEELNAEICSRMKEHGREILETLPNRTISAEPQ